MGSFKKIYKMSKTSKKGNKMATRGRARRRPIENASQAVVLTRSRSHTRSQTRAEPLQNQLIQPQPSAGPKLVWPNMPDLPDLPNVTDCPGSPGHCPNPMPSSVSPVDVEEKRPLKISKSEVLTPVPTPSVSQSVSQSSLAESITSLREIVQPTVAQIREKLVEWATGDSTASPVNSACASPVPVRPNSPVRDHSLVRDHSPDRVHTPQTDVLYRSESPVRPENPQTPVRSESPVLVMTPSGPEVIMPELHFEKLDENSSKTDEISSKNLLAEWNRNVLLLIKVSLVFWVAFKTLSSSTDCLRDEDLLPGFLFDFKRTEEFMNIPDPVTVFVSATSVFIAKHSVKYFQ